jgi:hypothetical protein
MQIPATFLPAITREGRQHISDKVDSTDVGHSVVSKYGGYSRRPARVRQTSSLPPIRRELAEQARTLPEKLLTNADLEKMVETNDAWIVERTGIQAIGTSRPKASTPVTSDSLPLNAHLQAAGLTAQDIDMIIFCHGQWRPADSLHGLCAAAQA